jgi:hypothetical protein
MTVVRKLLLSWTKSEPYLSASRRSRGGKFFLTSGEIQFISKKALPFPQKHVMIAIASLKISILRRKRRSIFG